MVFVLGGGGNRGAVQVGMLYALLEAGIVPEAVVGTSVGALNGAYLSGHPNLDGMTRLAGFWAGLSRREVFPVSLRGLFGGLCGRHSYLFSSLGLRRLLSRIPFGFSRLEEALLPICIVATDILTSEEVVLSSGSVVDALLASSAIPGVYPPVDIGGRLLVDGAVTADIPLAQAESLCPRSIYVLSTSPDARRQAQIWLPRVLSAHEITGPSRITSASPRGVGGPRLNTTIRVVPVPTTVARLAMFDFSATSQLIDEGWALTTAWLKSSVTEERAPADRVVA